MLITRTSMFSGKVRSMDLPITEAQIIAYQNGELIQNAFPNLTPSEREFYKSGITQEEWDILFEDEQAISY
jgi:hypothetical protein